MTRRSATRYSRYTSLISDARSVRIIELKKRLAELHQIERNLKAILASEDQSKTLNTEAQHELNQTLKTIAELDERLKRVEGEP